jgi:hypothetical protein
VGSSTAEITRFKQEMTELFSTSGLGELSYYLDIEVRQRDGLITLSQATYARKLLQKAGMDNCNSCTVPMESRLKLSKKGEGNPVDATPYRSLVGSLRYLTHTRPEITFCVG